MTALIEVRVRGNESELTRVDIESIQHIRADGDGALLVRHDGTEIQITEEVDELQRRLTFAGIFLDLVNSQS